MSQLSNLTRPGVNINDSEPGFYHRRGSFQGGGVVQSKSSVLLHTDGDWYQYIGNQVLPFNVDAGSSPDDDWKNVGEARASIRGFRFANGAELNNPNDFVYSEDKEAWFYWAGEYPKNVSPESSPETTGGYGPDAWREVGSSLLKSTTGASQIGTTDGKTVQDFIDKTQILSVNVRDPRFAGGAKGDWNQATGTGTDDTAAFQAAIDYLVTLPDMRHAGVRGIDLGSGSYYTKGLVVPQTYVFGFAMFGDGWTSCNLFCDVANPDTTSGILLKCEFANFQGIRMLGAKADNINDNTKRCNIITSKLADMRADCDVTVRDCFMASARSCVQLYGRGLIMDHILFGSCTNCVEIVADPTQLWPTGADQGNGVKTGMRNYRMADIRTDGATYLLAVSGTGAQKDYINGVLIQGVDMYSSSGLLNIPDATLRNLVIDGLVGQEACPFGLVTGKSINGAIFSNIATSKSITRDEAVTGTNPAMAGLMNMTGALDNIVFNNCDFGPIRNSFITVGAESSNITMTNINLHRLFSATAESATNLVLVSGANVNGFRADNWNITGAGPGAGKNVLACVASVQNSNRFSMTNINSKFAITGCPIARTPAVTFGSTAASPSVAFVFVDYQGQYVEITGAISVSANGMPVNSALNITTGLALLPMVSAQTSSIAGGGLVYFYAESDASVTSYPIPAHARITSGGVIQFYKASNGQILTSTDMGINATVHSIQFTIRCKIDPANFV